MKIVKILFQLGLFAILISIAFLLLTSKTNRLAGIQSFVVLTGSMQPTIGQGSVIFTRTQHNYKKNDIVAFQQGNITITHRIVDARGQNQFITRGDANNKADDAVLSQKDVLGKEIITIPYVGALVFFLRTPLGFASLVIIPALLYIVVELRVIKMEMEKEIEKKFAKRFET